ncbi:PorP/SprF family type IX secretion system membrane protein [Pedobacter sp. KR3-3]|uniref:PorP/SprF family type IX secretion system membrane protein n=1 Tax=Pedobacter albus TaxID=3113905 RepID=A0ABU7I3N5_9SPHI|nr:PorP/SprF family type IX secretion system membrane protein [Pedobacter sp. KR3-3]MEE1943971.1 PorP/SprF family type IX secretion system membrane protein [Pedobacter sp. KR3-3]
MKKIRILMVLGTLCCALNSNAQLDPMSSQYFNNRYQANASFAGIEHGINLNAGLRSMWNNIPGAPVTQVFTFDYGFQRSGVGLNVYNDKAGLQRQTKVLASYAYHLPLNEHNNLHFGVSLGFTNQRLSTSDINGNPNDVLVGQYNDRETYVDGDFGVAFTSSRLTLQASLPNLNKLFNRDNTKQADISRLYSAISYKIPLTSGGLSEELIEPLVAYRMIEGYKDILDVGAQAALINQQVLLSAIYHSSENMTFGIGMDYKKKYLISGLYTTNTSSLNNYTNGSFEIYLRLKFGR